MAGNTNSRLIDGQKINLQLLKFLLIFKSSFFKQKGPKKNPSFQLVCCEDLLLLSVLCDNTINTFNCWAGGQTRKGD